MKRGVFLWGLGPLTFTSPLSAQQYVPHGITGTGGHPLPLSWRPEAACPGCLCLPPCLPSPTPPHGGAPPSLWSQSDPDTPLSFVDFVMDSRWALSLVTRRGHLCLCVSELQNSSQSGAGLTTGISPPGSPATPSLTGTQILRYQKSYFR